ncbi:SMI1/KNR4 family protein [uncultured Dokdonia sp.]|uniref:SMI1/KNR4 family protein n=1 Tax=uncultured Dokdonia sp. TaxID=575653 RepID=UPI002622904A|nr:SMI1/KNR4 family protein [uncultured Dokdonia sp.]
MSKEINTKASALFNSYPELDTGRTATLAEYKSLKWNIRRKVSKWFLELMTMYPVTDLDIGIPFNYGWDSLKDKKSHELPVLNTRFNSFKDIELEATESFPGVDLIKKGWICIAFDENISGDGFYIRAKESNPKVIYVYHDCGTNAKELIAQAQVIANSFTEFLEIIKPQEDIDDWMDKNNV